jgi:hypothetical protein
LIENNEGNSIGINHEDSDHKYDNQLVVFEYIVANKKRIPPNEISIDAPVISEIVDISSIIPNKHGHYVLGINNGISKYKITGLLPNREFIIHFIKQDRSPDKYIGLTRGSTNALEPLEPPTALRMINIINDKVELDWTQPEGADGTILIVSKDRLPQLPQDSTKYKANNKYGTNYTVIDGITYTVFMGDKPDEPVVIENLVEDGVYYFQVISYNGGNYNFNYNTKATPTNTFAYNKGKIQE